MKPAVLTGDVARPVVALAREFAPGERIPTHAHAAGQLLHSLTGVMLAETPLRAWAIPPGSALWIPPRVAHSFSTSGAVSVRTVYVRARNATLLPREPVIVQVNSLLRELIARTLELDAGNDDELIRSLIEKLFLAELRKATRQQAGLVFPRSRNLQQLARFMRAHPSDRQSLASLARRIGLSEKTLTRRFKQETGLTPDRWRRHERLQAAFAAIRSGTPVTRVASDFGFESTSNFSAAFRRTFGTTPREARRK